MSHLETIISHKILPKFWKWVAEKERVKLFQIIRTQYFYDSLKSPKTLLATKGFHRLEYCTIPESISLKYIFSEAIPKDKILPRVKIFGSF